MTLRCPWTGAALPTSSIPAHQKKFASPAVRNEAHTAARMYTEHLIADGKLTWGTVRAWFQARKNGASAPCTGQETSSEHDGAP